jgi:hypothetical protein
MKLAKRPRRERLIARAHRLFFPHAQGSEGQHEETLKRFRIVEDDIVKDPFHSETAEGENAPVSHLTPEARVVYLEQRGSKKPWVELSHEQRLHYANMIIQGCFMQTFLRPGEFYHSSLRPPYNNVTKERVIRQLDAIIEVRRTSLNALNVDLRGAQTVHDAALLFEKKERISNAISIFLAVREKLEANKFKW